MGSQLKSVAAKVNAQKGGLHGQRRGGESAKLQQKIVELAAKHPGFTASQLCWKAAGFEVSESGHCLPAELFAKVHLFFNGKRRLSEATCGPDQLDDKPRARMVYGTAVCNPYGESGGHGIYPIGRRSGQTAPLAAQVRPSAVKVDRFAAEDKPAEPAVAAAPAVDVSERLANLSSLLGD